MRKILALVIAVMLLVGCGGGDGSESSEGNGAAATTLPSVEQDKQLAGRIVLTAADLPGYREAREEDDDEGIERAFAGCVQNDTVLTAQEPGDPRTVEGNDFRKGDEQSLGSKATIAETDVQAQAALARLRDQTVLRCLEGAVRREAAASLDPGVTLQTITVSNLPVATVGDDTVGLRIQVTLGVQGQTVPVTSDLTVMRRGRAVAFLFTAGAGTFPSSERDALATKMAERMA